MTKLVRIAGIWGQSCFHNFGLTTIGKWDPICVALVSVISVAGLTVFITDVALGGNNYLIIQLHFYRITFFTEVRQMVHKIGSQWWSGIRDILPVVQRNNNSDVSLHYILTRIFGRRDDSGRDPGALTFVINKNSHFIFILGCHKNSLNKNGEDSPEKQMVLHLEPHFFWKNRAQKSGLRCVICKKCANDGGSAFLK